MPRLIMAGDGDSERELCIPAPVGCWDLPEASPVAARESLAETFMELREPVCRYLLALGLRPSEAEEVVQEAFLRLCQHVSAGGTQSNVKGWVFRVAHNLARDEHRRRQRRPSQSLDEDPVHAAYSDPAASPEQQAIVQQRQARLAVALDQLPRHQRECLHLRAEGLRYREIAEVLDAGVSTVADWVQQALRTLGKECDENHGR